MKIFNLLYKITKFEIWINYNGQTIKYENKRSIHTNYDLKEPTKEELDKHIRYNNLIHDFIKSYLNNN